MEAEVDVIFIVINVLVMKIFIYVIRKKTIYAKKIVFYFINVQKDVIKFVQRKQVMKVNIIVNLIHIFVMEYVIYKDFLENVKQNVNFLMDMGQNVFVQKMKRNIIVKKNVNYVEMYFVKKNISIKLIILMTIIYAKKNMIVMKNALKKDIVKLLLIWILGEEININSETKIKLWNMKKLVNKKSKKKNVI